MSGSEDESETSKYKDILHFDNIRIIERSQKIWM